MVKRVKHTRKEGKKNRKQSEGALGAHPAKDWPLPCRCRRCTGGVRRGASDYPRKRRTCADTPRNRARIRKAASAQEITGWVGRGGGRCQTERIYSSATHVGVALLVISLSCQAARVASVAAKRCQAHISVADSRTTRTTTKRACGVDPGDAELPCSTFTAGFHPLLLFLFCHVFCFHIHSHTLTLFSGRHTPPLRRACVAVCS